MEAVWTLVWMVVGAGLYALGHYMGGAGTVRRLQRDVEDELEQLSHLRERIRGRARRAAEPAPSTVDGAEPDKITRVDKKALIRARAQRQFPQLFSPGGGEHS